MASGEHRYEIEMEWTGNRGEGTANYRGYGRDHELRAPGKPVLAASSDAAFRGDKSRWNPEELLVCALASCHMLSYLHCCATAGVVVLGYTDKASGTMELSKDGSGRFTLVVLRPEVRFAAGSDAALAERLHHDAHAKCFIANSVNFPVECEPRSSV